ncbi:hypothetical protein Clacol_005385 [Clathrus columnatus]|uniref:MYND-type domain-containing protein n=1 Tax=Clathrus columnatus TaxID=1419009 RepID=A0AAV5AEL2_9AGAM|nr:hypothetical protein Clacol_005385 [Clathrus columnatus]
MPPTPDNPRCAVCYEPTSYWCSRCQQVWYCSADHLQSDWPLHKKNCRPALSPGPHHFAVSASPNQTISVTAIYFPINEEKPRLVSIECLPPSDLSMGPCPSPIIQGWFPNGRSCSLTLTQGLNQEPLRFPLQVHYDAEALSRSTPINRSVYRITSGQAPRQWHGAVVVLKYSGSRRQSYADASLNDLPALSAYFLGYN